jgi:hypothetical protein
MLVPTETDCKIIEVCFHVIIKESDKKVLFSVILNIRYNSFFKHF